MVVDCLSLLIPPTNAADELGCVLVLCTLAPVRVQAQAQAQGSGWEMQVRVRARARVRVRVMVQQID